MIPYESIYFHLGGVLKPKSILEIGTYIGRSIIWLTLGSRQVENIVCIDNESYQENTQKIAKQSLVDFGYTGDMKFIKADSITSDIIKKLNTKFDFIHIDGDHTYEGCLNDLEKTKELLNKDGVILIHDYDFPNVKKAIDDFIDKYNIRWKFQLTGKEFRHGGVMIRC